MGNRVGVTSVSGVQIPDSPPDFTQGVSHDAPCFLPHAEGWQSG